MTIEIKTPITATPAEVWAIIGSPGRVDWVAGVESCDFDGRFRTFAMQGAGKLVEEILLLDADAHLIEYGVVESTPPLTRHRASMQVVADGDFSTLIWKTAVEPVQVEPFIVKGMEGSIELLLKLLNTV